MGANSFGDVFSITTFGESHGQALGVVIDGCPAGIEICADEINEFLKLRAPGGSACVSQRREPDQAEIVSGVFAGKTLGSPICILVRNNDADASYYDDIKEVLRPGHANYTYLKKYGVVDHRGGGRASGRETVARVAAGAVAIKCLQHFNITAVAFIEEIGGIKAKLPSGSPQKIRELTYANVMYCPDAVAADDMQQHLIKISKKGDSVGGAIGFIVFGVKPGVGDPVFSKVTAKIGSALLSIPGVKGFELGDGFAVTNKKGSEHNDVFINVNGMVKTKTNHAGGVLGGVSNGMPIYGRIALKPTPSIFMPQQTVDVDGNDVMLRMRKNNRHDPCIAIRAVPVVEAMCAIAILDMVLLNKTAKIGV